MQVAMQHVANVKKERSTGVNPKSEDAKGHDSLLKHILDSDMPESELSDERLAKEAQVLLGGGTASTARTIGYISYYVLARADIRFKLHQELKAIISTWPRRVPSLTELERLPNL